MRMFVVLFLRVVCAVSILSAVLGQAAPIVLSPASALPPGSGIDRGFIVRTVQGPTNEVLANSFNRAVRQLNGTLRDSTGQLVSNEALPGPRPDGSYLADVVNFELDGQPVHNFLLNSTFFPG